MWSLTGANPCRTAREPNDVGSGRGFVVAPVHVLRMCTITDEIPQDLDHVLGAYEELGINTVELCVVGGVNVVSHDEAGIARKVAAVEDRCVRVGATASLSSSATSIATASREAAHSWGSTYSVTYPTAGSSAR
jgi:hypothetical protein